MSRNSPVKSADNFFIGEDKVLQFEVVDESDQIVDITGWAMEFVLRDYPEAPTVVLTKTTDDDIALSNPTLGICRVTIPRADTLQLNAQSYSYTLRRTDAGYSAALAFGDFLVKEPSSR